MPASSSQLPAITTSQFLSQDHIASATSTPPESPMSSPERYSESPSSDLPPAFEHLPPAMSAHGSTPAPSADHLDMVLHQANLVLEDDDDETLQDNRQRRRHLSQHQYDQSPQSTSQPTSPALPPTTASTVLAHPLSNSITVAPSTGISDTSLSFAEPISATASPSHTSSSTMSESQGSQSNNNNGSSNFPLSPFSFFTQGSSVSHSELPHSVGSKTLKIVLAQSEVVLRGGQATVLEGVVFVNLNKNTKVKSLQLEFSGRSSVTWVDDNAYSPATRHTTAPHIEHTWALIPHQHKQPPTLLQSGQHVYPFSLELPDTLPETLTTTHGKVAYRLTGTLTKPGLTFYTSTATIPVLVHRKHPIQPSRAYLRGGRAVSAPDDKIQYKITVPQARVPHSTKIPLQVSITTLALRTHVQVLQVALWERAVYRADGRKRVDMRLVKIQKSEGWERPPHAHTEAWNWNKVLLFDMPSMGSEHNQCNPSADNGLMKVGHILRFSILGTDGSKRFRVENEIDIKVLAFEDEFEEDPEDEDEEGLDRELPSYLTSFSTPRVSFDSEREMDPADDDLLRAMIQRIHLPTYAESEEDANSRSTSRDVSRNTSRAASRNPSRGTSPERSMSAGNLPHHQYQFHNNLHPLPQHHSGYHFAHGSAFNTSYPSTPTTPVSPSPLATSSTATDNDQELASLPALPAPLHHPLQGRSHARTMSHPMTDDSQRRTLPPRNSEKESL
ncbi:hypothetical protein BG011_009355 [Mortierella polycephala]|uniref:Arrestin C-terminal-like domain-containing protein n=1 Tax=Mortierella polycephala TaxID=41804 RepID=A0A9P6Q8W7_9FUNG|nr:hypothetical protein BG011_009355 [Mortierella polycephala]